VKLSVSEFELVFTRILSHIENYTALTASTNTIDVSLTLVNHCSVTTNELNTLGKLGTWPTEVKMAGVLTSPLPQIVITRENSDTPVPLATCMSRNGQCTHHTMTRIYNPNFNCAICLKPGPFGWLYRCIQDRELIIEQNLKAGNQVWFPSHELLWVKS